MDYTFESLINDYDNIIIEEYCYGNSYYTEDKKQGLLEKIGEFISNLCEKIMNGIKLMINKITGKNVYVKVPKGMKEHVKKTESWFDLFKKAVAAIKKGAITAIKKIISLMKEHPIITSAVIVSTGFILVKTGVYAEWAGKLSTIAGRVKDAISVLIGKKQMVDKDIYDSAIDAFKSSQNALSKTQAQLTACKIENAEKDEELIKTTRVSENRKKKIGSLNDALNDTKSKLMKSDKSLLSLTDANEKLKSDYNKTNSDLEKVRGKYKLSLYDKATMRLNEMKKDPSYRKFINKPEIQELINDHLGDLGENSMSEFAYNRLFRQLSRAFDDFNKK